MILLLLACTGPGPDSDLGDTGALEPRRALLQGLARDVVAPSYAELATRADTLAAAAGTFCAAPDASGLDVTRAAWLDARAPWKQAEVVMFGPVVEQPYRLGPPIDFWPARTGVIDDLLASDAPLTAASVGELGASGRGFPVVEYLLWGPGEGTLAAMDARRCAYLTAATADLAASAHALVAAWDATIPALVQPEDHPDDPWETPQDVIDEWVNRMFFTVENIRHEKLGKPYGDTSGGSPLPDALESRFSGRSLKDARDAFVGTERALEGGIAGLLPEDRQEVAADLRAANAAVHAAFDAVPEPLESAIVDDRPSVRALQDALRESQIVLQVELAQALSVTITFNDNDGD